MTDCSVPAPGAKDGLDAGTVEAALQEGGAMRNGAGEAVVLLIEAVGNDDNEAAALEELHGRLDLFGQHFGGGSDDGDGVASGEARHRLGLKRERDNGQNHEKDRSFHSHLTS